MAKRHYWYIVLATAFASACQHPLQAPSVPVPPLERASSTTATPYPWPQAEWWHDLNDSQLNAVLSVALNNSPNLQVTAARIEQAAGVATMVGASNKPLLGAEAMLSAQRFSANYIQNKLADQAFGALAISPVTLRYHLDFWGRDRAILAAAIGTEHAVAAEYAQARILLTTALARTYLRLGFALKRLQHASALLETQTRLRKLFGTRHTTGLDAGQTQFTIEQGLALTQQRVASEQSEIQLLRNQLAALAGREPAWAATIQPTDLDLTKRLPLPTQLPLSLLSHRADVHAARCRAEAAAQAVQVAHTQFYPDVNLLGFAGFQTVNLTDLLFLGKNAAFALGPSLTMPLFMGGQLEGNFTQREGEYHAAVAAYNQSLVRALQDTADALTRLQDSRQREHSQLQAVSAAKRQLQLVESLHRAGLNHSGQVLEAQYRTIEQSYQLTNQTAEINLAAVDLIEALGGGYITPSTP